MNLLINAYRPDAVRHAAYRAWLEARRAEAESFLLPDLVVVGLVRITTNPRVYARPDPPEDVLAFARSLRRQKNCAPIPAGSAHWPVFVDLCVRAEARGNLVTDAYLAALALASDATLMTDDLDFTRFPGLRWRRPLD